ncbi:MAG: hypothetical protein ACK5KQ_00900 [Anaerorhabdus sp.]
MKISDVVNNVEVFGIESSVRGSKFPMAVDLEKIDGEVTNTTKRLATSKLGEGHDNFLNGIIVQFDLSFSNKAWVEMQRYHFIDFISSQSTMHRITRFNMDKAFIEHVDIRIVEIMKEKIKNYNETKDKINEYKEKGIEFSDLSLSAKKQYLEILYSNPAGFIITARMTTNYRQLKTIYLQRRTHRLPEWQAFCDWVETLPYAEFILPNRTQEKG